jgi:hypothetical protein
MMAWTAREIRVPAGIDLAAYGREEWRWAHQEEIRREYCERPFDAAGVEEELAEGPAARASPVWRLVGAARERGFTMLVGALTRRRWGLPLADEITQQGGHDGVLACPLAMRLLAGAPVGPRASLSFGQRGGPLRLLDRQRPRWVRRRCARRLGHRRSPLLTTVAGWTLCPPRVWTLCHNPGNYPNFGNPVSSITHASGASSRLIRLASARRTATSSHGD